jgi:patatin-like phospholipase/acyl hydrolase
VFSQSLDEFPHEEKIEEAKFRDKNEQCSELSQKKKNEGHPCGFLRILCLSPVAFDEQALIQRTKHCFQELTLVVLLCVVVLSLTAT